MKPQVCLTYDPGNQVGLASVDEGSMQHVEGSGVVIRTSERRAREWGQSS